uniref:Zgc:109913 n=2 Tax=Hippocampus comes TaxID=109280 RepID=A0A3Q3DGZ3_HIPCM
MSERHDGGERAQERLARVTSCFQTLVRLTSCFQQLAVSLGSSADCAFLRREIAHVRALATNVANGLSCHLTHLLSNCNSGPAGPASSAERRELERVWVHFLSAMENFLRDLRKVGDLIVRFPLGQQKDRRSLINTGCLDGVVGVATRAASVRMPWLASDVDDLHQESGLQEHLNSLEAMMSDMQLRVPVAFWSVEATQPTSGEITEEAEEGLEEASAEESSVCCRPSARSGLGCAWS